MKSNKKNQSISQSFDHWSVFESAYLQLGIQSVNNIGYQSENKSVKQSTNQTLIQSFNQPVHQ